MVETIRSWVVMCALGVLLVGADRARGQEAAAGGATAEGAAGIAEAKLAGHNAWMLTSCALVLFMTAPGLAMFYGGLVRKKNVLGVIMQCLFLMGLMTVLWGLYGYSLAFGESGGGRRPYIGGGQYLFMEGVARHWNESTKSIIEPMVGAIPRLTHMLFQGM